MPGVLGCYIGIRAGPGKLLWAARTLPPQRGEDVTHIPHRLATRCRRSLKEYARLLTVTTRLTCPSGIKSGEKYDPSVRTKPMRAKEPGLGQYRLGPTGSRCAPLNLNDAFCGAYERYQDQNPRASADWDNIVMPGVLGCYICDTYPTSVSYEGKALHKSSSALLTVTRPSTWSKVA